MSRLLHFPASSIRYGRCPGKPGPRLSTTSPAVAHPTRFGLSVAILNAGDHPHGLGVTCISNIQRPTSSRYAQGDRDERSRIRELVQTSPSVSPNVEETTSIQYQASRSG